MRSQNKNPKITNRMSSSSRGSSQRSGDVDSRILQKISKSMGLSGLQSELNQRSHQRDELLAFVCHRLQKVQQVQQLELAEMDNNREWFRDVARGKPGYFLPQPTRWHECAESFKRAAQAFCQGHLGRGKQLLEQALEQEKSAYDSLPKQVSEQLNKKDRSGDAAPSAVGDISQTAVCPVINQPKELRIADQILNVQDVMRNVSPLRRLGALKWWESPEEEEQEEQEELTEDEESVDKQEEEFERPAPQKQSSPEIDPREQP